jgi:hypothetical protein
MTVDFSCSSGQHKKSQAPLDPKLFNPHRKPIMKTLLLLTALTAIGIESKAADIDGATIAMDSLMACQESRTNGQTMSEMIRKKQRPIRKGEATWTYAA